MVHQPRTLAWLPSVVLAVSELGSLRFKNAIAQHSDLSETFAMRKKVDSRIRTLVENCHKLRQRSMFVIVGDKGRDQVVNLHYMLSKTVVKARPSVLWCYKKDLYLSRCSADHCLVAAPLIAFVVAPVLLVWISDATAQALI